MNYNCNAVKNWKKIYTTTILFLLLLNNVSAHAQNSPQQTDNQILKIGCMQLEGMGQIDEKINKIIGIEI